MVTHALPVSYINANRTHAIAVIAICYSLFCTLLQIVLCSVLEIDNILLFNVYNNILHILPTV